MSAGRTSSSASFLPSADSRGDRPDAVVFFAVPGAAGARPPVPGGKVTLEAGFFARNPTRQTTRMATRAAATANGRKRTGEAFWVIRVSRVDHISL